MPPVQKALWFIESHFRDDVNLEQIARSSHISQYHLARAFTEVFGVSLMKYVRSRRLSEAAKQISEGAPDILSLALEFGYGSHEAFTRAFKKEFGVTPESVRSLSDIEHLELTEPIDMSTENLPDLEPPQVEQLDATCFAGLVERYSCSSPAGIPNQWQRFAPFLGRVKSQLDANSYGVCFNPDEEGNFDYMSGVAIKCGSPIPAGLVQLSLPAQQYAVFHHGGHISEIRSVMTAIWSVELAKSGHEPARSASLERYGPSFDGRTGLGGFEIMIAIK